LAASRPGCASRFAQLNGIAANAHAQRCNKTEKREETEFPKDQLLNWPLAERGGYYNRRTLVLQLRNRLG